MTLGLIVLAGVLIVVSNSPTDDTLASTITGAVIGYWLGHIERSLNDATD